MVSLTVGLRIRLYIGLRVGMMTRLKVKPTVVGLIVRLTRDGPIHLEPILTDTNFNRF